jgi:hypothetical protein
MALELTEKPLLNESRNFEMTVVPTNNRAGYEGARTEREGMGYGWTSDDDSEEVVLKGFATAFHASEIKFEGIVANNGLKNIGPLPITANAAGGALSAILAGLMQDTLETLDWINLSYAHLSVACTGSGNGSLFHGRGDKP